MFSDVVHFFYIPLISQICVALFRDVSTRSELLFPREAELDWGMYGWILFNIFASEEIILRWNEEENYTSQFVVS